MNTPEHLKNLVKAKPIEINVRPTVELETKLSDEYKWEMLVRLIDIDKLSDMVGRKPKSILKYVNGTKAIKDVQARCDALFETCITYMPKLRPGMTMTDWFVWPRKPIMNYSFFPRSSIYAFLCNGNWKPGGYSWNGAKRTMQRDVLSPEEVEELKKAITNKQNYQIYTQTLPNTGTVNIQWGTVAVAEVANNA